MFDHQLPQIVSEQLSGKLPGIAAQRTMEPNYANGRHFGPIAEDHRPAAVILLLYQTADQWHLPLTLRQGHLPSHAGQISFPGGSVENNETSQQAALRELQEELDVESSKVQILGKLSSLYIFSTKFLITPWVGYCADQPNFQMDENEVADIFEIPLSHFFDHNHRVEIDHQRGELSFSSPAYVWNEHHIWGATSMILSEFLAVLENINKN